MREHAVGPAAVRHDLDVLGQLRDTGGQLLHGDRHRSRDVPGRVFTGRPHVEHDDVTDLRAAQQFNPNELLGVRPVTQVVATGRVAWYISGTARPW